MPSHYQPHTSRRLAPANRYRLEGTGYGVICYRSSLDELRLIAKSYECKVWGRTITTSNRVLPNPGLSYGLIRIFDRKTKQYV